MGQEMTTPNIDVRPDHARDRVIADLGAERLKRAWMVGVLELSPDESEALAGQLYDATDELEAERDRADGWPAERVAIVGCLPPVGPDGETVVTDDDGCAD